ncbi:MAG: 7-carboxy-7-deazaguanine synthase QueE [Blastocatellia bacterium]|nr:7-carboxy-7-deazaguanine synthase QueE [Blastocatellia bacterium]
MRITEIFFSIQGESSFAGLPCTFVRTTGCDLRCSWCDSEYTFTGGTEMSLPEIMERVRSYPTRLVELTGGEPLLQREIHQLAGWLLDEGFQVLIETGGHRDVSQLDPRVIKVMDLKCPGSGEAMKNRWENLSYLTPQDEIKFVLADVADYHWAREVIREYQLETRCRILLSTVFGVERRPIVEHMLADGLQARFQVQLHKLVWPADMKGV